MPSRRSLIMALALSAGCGPLSALAQVGTTERRTGRAAGRSAEGADARAGDAAADRAVDAFRPEPGVRKRAGTGGLDVALLIPRYDGPFARAAASLLAGVLAAHGRDGAGVVIEAIEVDDQADELAAVYAELAGRSFDLVLGPVTRSGAGALLELGPLSVPTLALNFPDADQPLPPNLVLFGIGTEGESRQVAAQAYARTQARAPERAPRAAVVAFASPLARRSAQAFREAWLALGGQCREPIEFSGPRPPRDLRAQFGVPGPDIVFLAMGPEQARIVRQGLGARLPVYGTSLISAGGAASQLRLPELDGVRLLEMPWYIEPENAAVMAYPKPPPGFNVEMQRLYALGIDAFRVARQLLGGQSRFELDGVTGRLHYDSVAAPRVERLALQAEYRNGTPVPLDNP